MKVDYNRKRIVMNVRVFVIALFCSSTALSQLVESKLVGASEGSFGNSVAISGDYAIIGAPWDNSGSGSARIFKRDGTVWSEQANLVDSTSSQFGFSVSISSGYAVVSALSDFSNQGIGKVHIYRRDNEIWSQEEELSPPDVDDVDGFGVSTSLSGDRAIVGAFTDRDLGLNSGSAYVFRRDGTTWIQEAKLLASDGSKNDAFGTSDCLSGDYALIGAASSEGYKGSAYVFLKVGEEWVEQFKLVADVRSQAEFGSSVSLDGEYAIIGADYDTINGTVSGSAYIFKREGQRWSQVSKIFAASDGGSGDQFGHSVSIFGDYALVGAVGDDHYGFNTGSAYLYKRNGTDWTEVNYFSASDVSAEDAFGVSVFIDGSNIIVGSPGDDDLGFNSGAAYVYSGFQVGDSLAQFGVSYGSTGSAEPNNPGALVTIDPVTGAGTLIGPTGIIGDDGPAVRALAIKSTGEMYALNYTVSSDLYSVNASTGAATFVANTGLLHPGDIVFNANDVLYAVDETNILYTIDPVTGLRTVVGPTGVILGGLAYDPTTGTVYGSDNNDGIVTIDVTAGVATLVGTTGLGGNTPDILFDQAGICSV